jgi:hypothetical protein
MSNDDTGRRRKSGRRSDPQLVRRFLQELSWLLSNYSDLDYSSIGELSQRFDATTPPPSILTNEHAQTPAANSLVGILPDLFTDETLFPSNEDIASFAKDALGVVIPRWSKKSKYEIIGHVVCHTSMAVDERLARVVDALNKVTKNREAASRMIHESKAKGISWNELIQQLIRE